MMNEMNMPLTYWTEAVYTAVHIMNQTPIAAIHEISPYERLYGIKPTVSYMKVFGCVCYVHVPNEARKNMEPKAVKCIFLGYPVEKKGYKCYDPTTRQVYVSRDVRFCEHEPWYKPKPVTIEDEYEEQENVRRVVDESGPSTRTISGTHMIEESIGSVNPWSGRLRDKKKDERGKKKMFEESSGDESFDEEHGLPHLRTPGTPKWSNYIIDYLTSGILSQGMSKSRVKTITKEAENYVLIEDKFYRRGKDDQLRMCATKEEYVPILEQAHSGQVGRHVSADKMAKAILVASIWWHTLFMDAEEFVKRCDECQRTKIPRGRDDRSLRPMMGARAFAK
ncbi:hypothetical protein L7F22_007902 [Adiantum nelumboides]|nr:hypothetical protein [Adiantum nelumboides]